MNMKRFFSAAMVTLVCAAGLLAQTGLPIKQIGGQPYYYYEIKNKETLYGVARQLGVSENYIATHNPWVNEGLEKKQLIFLPVPGQNTAQPTTEFSVPAGNDAATIHTIAQGETLCSIAKAYNMTVEGLMSANLGLAPDKYVAGERIRVVPNSAMPFVYEKKATHFTRYVAREGDTYSLIAHRNGIFVADLQAANPNMKKPKKGKMLVLPLQASEKATGDMRTISLADLESYYVPRLGEIYEQLLAAKRNSELNIGLILPFQLHKQEPPKQAYLYTDFYKGFLLALDSIKNTTRRKINVKVYDTQHNLNVTDSLLALPEMRDLTVVVAPSEPQQLARINKFGQQNGIDVLNCFSTKNDDYQNNPNVYQVNIPTKDLAENVMRWMDDELGECSVIYLEDPDAEDKDIFTDFRAHIAARGISYSSITVTGELSYDRLSREMNPGTRYVFIPSSGSKNLLKKVVRALKQAKQERFDCDMVMLGYPEYVLYLKDYQDDLQTIDTYMFSRFFNAKGFRTRDFDTLYRRWFGGETLTAYPNMGLLGYDTAMFIVQAFNETGSMGTAPLHKGIQTSFRFERQNNWGGYVNQAFDIVHFTTDHTIITNVR